MTTATSQWEIARLAKTMAMKCTIELDPGAITPRVKNSVKRQLRAGYVTGGQSSQAAKLTTHLANRFSLPIVHNHYRGVPMKGMCATTRLQVLELLDADWALALIEGQVSNNNRYYRERYQEQRASLTGEARSRDRIGFLNDEYAEKAKAAVAESRTPVDLQRIENAIALLDDTELIYIATYQ
jgi:hypothetical protein